MLAGASAMAIYMAMNNPFTVAFFFFLFLEIYSRFLVSRAHGGGLVTFGASRVDVQHREIPEGRSLLCHPNTYSN